VAQLCQRRQHSSCAVDAYFTVLVCLLQIGCGRGGSLLCDEGQAEAA
jgi:hypothetical protein